MLEDALVLDATGKPIPHQGKTKSCDWDEVEEFCRKVYMPYRVRPLERFSEPDATMLSRKVGRLTMTRFSYGTGIYLDQFDPSAGNILVLNTLRGALNHSATDDTATTRSGESFVVDCSRTEYWLEGDPDHMQFNLTIPHDVMEEVAERWYGIIPDDRLWTARVKFGAPQSAWLRLLDYAAASLSGTDPAEADSVMGRHLEETICLELLRIWAKVAGLPLATGSRAAAPGYVRRAEEILETEAREAPLIGQVAQRVGVSARTLSGGFRRFRGLTPRAFLADLRLRGFRRDLQAASDQSVSQIAAAWGFSNFGALAGRYRKRFGELPVQTRARCKR